MISMALKRFLGAESAGGIVLALAAALALIISNSPWGESYEALRQLPGELRIGGDALVLAKPLVVWVNDLWMAVFFFLVGLEIKREFVEGELASRAQAVLPAVAALGGMLVPALIYYALNHGDPVAARGWAIPAATDIAFALGVLLLLGDRVPTSLKVFLTAVAIIDDLGAIVVIALFYTEQLSLPMLLGAAGCGLMLWGLNRSGQRRVEAYVLVGLVMWLFVLKSGVHATLAGVLTALAVPTARCRRRLAAAIGGARAAPLGGLWHPAGVRLFQCRRVASRACRRATLLQSGAHGHRPGPGAGQDGGHPGQHRTDGLAGLGPAAQRRQLDAVPGHGPAVRHRLHHEPVHWRVGLRGPGPGL